MCRQKLNIPSDCTQDTLTKCTSSSGSFFFTVVFFHKYRMWTWSGVNFIKLFWCYSTKTRQYSFQVTHNNIMMLSYLLWLIKCVSFPVCFFPLLCIENCRWIKKGWLLKYYACVKPNWPFFYLLKNGENPVLLSITLFWRFTNKITQKILFRFIWESLAIKIFQHPFLE